MTAKMSAELTNNRSLASENEDLRERLREAEETLDAIRSGEVEALVMGDQIFMLQSAEAESNRDDAGSARSALQRIQGIEARLDASNDIVRAGLARYHAWLTLKDATKACTALSNVKDRASGTSYQGKVDALLLGC